MASFVLDPDLAADVREFMAERDVTLTEMVRHALAIYDDVPRVATRGIAHSIRLDRRDTARLARLVRRAGVSKSRTLALLIEQALDDLTREPDDTPPMLPPVTRLPGPRAYKMWAHLLSDCADVAHTRTPDDHKAWLGSVISVLEQRVSSERAGDVRARMIAILPELHQRGLVVLSACHATRLYPGELVEASEIRHGSATWHFIEPPPTRG